MDKPRAAIPADARDVWQSIVNSGGKPSTRRVAAALAASGQFLPLGHNAIARWKRAGWKANSRKGNRQSPMMEAAEKLDAAVPALTGDPTTRTKDVVSPPPSAPSGGGTKDQSKDDPGIPTYDELNELADDDLMRKANRDTYITNIIVNARIRAGLDNLIKDRPRELGSLQDALAGTLVRANDSFITVSDRAMKIIPGNAKAEEDPLRDVWDIYDKKASA